MKRALFLSVLAATLLFSFFNFKTALALPVDVTGLCFSPNGGCTRLVVNRIDQASGSVWVMSYSFTSAPIAKALLRARGRGVDVQVVMDRDEEERQSYEVRMLIERGVPVYVDREAGIFHDKVMILDGNTVITGSMNWTKAGEHYNADNLIVLRSQKLAAYYLKNFQLHKAASPRVQSVPERQPGHSKWFLKKW